MKVGDFLWKTNMVILLRRLRLEKSPFLCDTVVKQALWGDAGTGQKIFGKSNAENARGFLGSIKFFPDDNWRKQLQHSSPFDEFIRKLLPSNHIQWSSYELVKLHVSLGPSHPCSGGSSVLSLLILYCLPHFNEWIFLKIFTFTKSKLEWSLWRKMWENRVEDVPETFGADETIERT